MKSLIRTYIFYLAALYITQQALSAGLVVSGGVEAFLIAALLLALLNLILKPILNLLFLPVNMLSLGLFSIVINAGLFYAFVYLLDEIEVNTWTFPGISVQGFSLQETEVSMLATIFIASILINFITNFFSYLTD